LASVVAVVVLSCYSRSSLASVVVVVGVVTVVVFVGIVVPGYYCCSVVRFYS